MHFLHPQARTTPAVRQEIARSREPTGVLAQRFSVSTETIRKWRKRGAQDCQDHSSRPHKLPWKATEEERAIVCALRQATGFPLDDLTFIVTHFLPHLNRDAVYRILKAEGLGRLPPAQQRQRKSGTFKDYDLGFVHMDIKHLPKLQTANGERRKRFLYVAIDRCSRWVHLAVKDDELATSAIAFLKEAVGAFPFEITHVLTDRGSCFTADGFEDAWSGSRVPVGEDPLVENSRPDVERLRGHLEALCDLLQDLGARLLQAPLDLRQIGIRDSGDLRELPQGQLGVLALLTQVRAEIGKPAHTSIMLTLASRMQTLGSVTPNTAMQEGRHPASLTRRGAGQTD